MATNKNTTKDPKIKDLDNQLNDLLDETKKVNKDIKATNREAENAMDNLDAKVNASVAKVERIYSDLDKMEKESGDKLDRLILEEAENLASDE